MILGEVNLKQYSIYKESFWSDLLNFFREFNGGKFNDNDIEVMLKELEIKEGLEHTVDSSIQIIDDCLMYMYDDLPNNECLTSEYNITVVGDVIILAYSYQSY